jgi:hypothetical protein
MFAQKHIEKKPLYIVFCLYRRRRGKEQHQEVTIRYSKNWNVQLYRKGGLLLPTPVYVLGEEEALSR